MSYNNINNNPNSNYIYPQPYIDPMIYLNPYYSNATGYESNSQGYIDYSQFNENTNGQNYQTPENQEYSNIPPEEDFNIPYIPYYPPPNMSNNQQNMPNMILPNNQYQALPPNMQNQGIPNQNQQNMPNQSQQSMPNLNIPYNQMTYMQGMPYMGYIPPMPKPMYPANMFPNMYPEVFPPNMMYQSYPFMNMGSDMYSVNMEEFDEEEM